MIGYPTEPLLGPIARRQIDPAPPIDDTALKLTTTPVRIAGRGRHDEDTDIVRPLCRSLFF